MLEAHPKSPDLKFTGRGGRARQFTGHPTLLTRLRYGMLAYSLATIEKESPPKLNLRGSKGVQPPSPAGPWGSSNLVGIAPGGDIFRRAHDRLRAAHARVGKIVVHQHKDGIVFIAKPRMENSP
jgi:hypothetical protein